MNAGLWDDQGRVIATLLPSYDGAFDLGSSKLRFRNIYVTQSLVYNNLSISGDLTFSAASAKIIPGATSLLFRNNADSATNFGISNAGVITLRNGSTINGTSAGSIAFSIDGDPQRLINLVASSDTVTAITFGDAGVTAAQEFQIHNTTADADDDGRVGVSGGGASFSSARGGQLNVYGNEHATKPGWAELIAGNVTGSAAIINCNIATGSIDLQIAGTPEITITNTAVTLPTNNLVLTAGDVLINGIGKGLQVKSGSNAKAGTVTANGATGVSVATTAITANSAVIFGLKTVGGTTAPVYMDTVTPGTGFNIKSTAGNTSVYNWVIVDLI